MADEQQMAPGVPTDDQRRHGSKVAIFALVAVFGVHLALWATDWFVYMLGVPDYISPLGQIFVDAGATLLAVVATLIYARWMVV